jgi:DNA (cytosine-5)-methyltransferase 1
MRFGSVCSSIEAASVAWHPIGWRAAWFSEIEPFPSAVLAHHYPDTPNLGDMTAIAAKVLTGQVIAPDVLWEIRGLAYDAIPASLFNPPVEEGV